MSKVNERVEDNLIVIDENGRFPKELLVVTKDEKGNERINRKYMFRKTRNGGYIIN